MTLLIETSRSYGRGLLRGIRRYVAENGPWSIYVEPRALDSQPPAWLKNWQGHGILTRTGSRALANLVKATRVPAVELRTKRYQLGIPWVGVDNRALGELVARHLMERGFRRFGLCALDTEDFFRERCANFVEAIHGHGYPCDVYCAPRNCEHPSQWEKQQDELTSWVGRLPKPVGIMACTDQLGFWLLDACQRAGVAVPEEVAVVGVENDDLLCSMASPPLSSVAMNTERIGYLAADLLDRLMRGHRVTNRDVFVEPLAIVTRQSSDVVAIEDEGLAAALRYIGARACEGIIVADVLRAVPVSRSKLERGFRQALGRSPNAAIRHVQLVQVQRLLVETDLTLAAIASRTGFSHVQYLCTVFKEKFGKTPGCYRAANRP